MRLSIVFVLVEAGVPENIGFAARAINTMGFSEMRLVNACNHLSKGARTTGYGSHDLLENAISYPSIPAALKDIDLSFGTTAKKRISRHDCYAASEVVSLIKSKSGTLGKVAIVFGSEEHGLTKAQLGFCDIVTSIPLATKYPSLNLAQAILIYAYELSGFNMGSAKQKKEVISATEQRAVKDKAIRALDHLGVYRQPSLYQRLKDRLMTADAGDIRLILSLLKYMERK